MMPARSNTGPASSPFNATTVTVAVDASGFTVAENDKGVGEAELNQIFERFYSGDGAQGGGTAWG